MRNFIFILLTLFAFISCKKEKTTEKEKTIIPKQNYAALQESFCQGWNTWNYRSVTSHVLMPEAFAINLGMKDYLNKDVLKETMLGFDREDIVMGPHAYDGSYTQLIVNNWSDMGYRKGISFEVETAHLGDELVVLVKPVNEIDRLKKPLLLIQSGFLWNRPGTIEKKDSVLYASSQDKNITVYTTGNEVEEYYVGGTTSPYLAVTFDGPVGVSTGKAMSIKEIESAIALQKTKWEQEKASYKENSEIFDAIQTVMAWNVVYEPQFDRVISPVSRRWSYWNRGYVQYNWDTYFAGLQAAATGSKEVAYFNLVEMTRAKAKAGTQFVPNVEQANGFISRDRSQPQVGSYCLYETYKIFEEKWILELLYDDMLDWNNWRYGERQHKGLISLGSTPYEPVVGSAGETTDNETINGWFGASMESGWDGAAQYIDAPFDKEKHILKEWDVAQNGLYVLDCENLANIADELGKTEDAEMLRSRADTIRQNMSKLWNEDKGFFFNRNWETGEFIDDVNISGFYPLIAQSATDEQATQIIQEYFYNEDHFWAPYIMPSLSISHPKFAAQKYWDGRIWPPVNYLVYLGLKNYEHLPEVKKAKDDLVRKSRELLMVDWKARRYVRENYNPLTGVGDESKASAKFYHWGGLIGLMSLMENK